RRGRVDNSLPLWGRVGWGRRLEVLISDHLRFTSDWLIDVPSSSACRPCDSVTAVVIVSKGHRAQDDAHAIRGCYEATIPGGWWHRARRCCADPHSSVGSPHTTIPQRRDRCARLFPNTEGDLECNADSDRDSNSDAD